LGEVEQRLFPLKPMCRTLRSIWSQQSKMQLNTTLHTQRSWLIIIKSQSTILPAVLQSHTSKYQDTSILEGLSCGLVRTNVRFPSTSGTPLVQRRARARRIMTKYQILASNQTQEQACTDNFVFQNPTSISQPDSHASGDATSVIDPHDAQLS
jgi:hypothetical protein